MADLSEPSGPLLPPNTGSARSALRRYAILLAVLLVVASGAALRLHTAWDSRQPVVVSVGAGPLGSDSYLYMSEVADVLARNNAKVRLKVVATRDASQNISLLNAGLINLAVARADTPLASDCRMIAALYPDYFQLLVAKEAPAYDVEGLAGLRIAVPEFGTDAQLSFFTVADHYDLAPEKVLWHAVSMPEARKGLIAGRYDGLFTVRSLRDPQMLALFEDAQLKNKGLRFIPIGQAEAIGLKRPFIKAGRIPFGAYTGDGSLPTADLPTAVVERVLVTRSGESAEAIRDITATLFDRRLELTLRFPLAASVTKPDLERSLSVPIHEGALQYYDREKPGLLESHSDQIGLIATLLAMAGSGLLALRSRFASRQKDSADVYNHALLDILHRCGGTCDAEGIMALRGEHEDILKTAVAALDNDSVTEEGFQSFLLLWNSVRAALIEKQSGLPERAPIAGG